MPLNVLCAIKANVYVKTYLHSLISRFTDLISQSVKRRMCLYIEIPDNLIPPLKDGVMISVKIENFPILRFFILFLLGTSSNLA